MTSCSKSSKCRVHACTWRHVGSQRSTHHQLPVSLAPGWSSQARLYEFVFRASQRSFLSVPQERGCVDHLFTSCASQGQHDPAGVAPTPLHPPTPGGTACRDCDPWVVLHGCWSRFNQASTLEFLGDGDAAQSSSGRHRDSP